MEELLVDDAEIKRWTENKGEKVWRRRDGWIGMNKTRGYSFQVKHTPQPPVDFLDNSKCVSDCSRRVRAAATAATQSPIVHSARQRWNTRPYHPR